MKFIPSWLKIDKGIQVEGRDVALRFIMTASLVLGIVAAVTFYFFHLVVGLPGSGVGYFGVTFIMLFFIFLSYLMRFGYHAFVSYALIFTYGLPTIWLLITAGFDVPQGVLLCALVICLINILLPSRVGIWWAISTITLYLLISFLEVGDKLHPRRDWHQSLHLSDAIIYVGTLAVIVVIAMLFNREIERSLKRALDSEKSLKEERDLLEERVEERTAELKQAQFERVLQVHRFADIGRHAGGLFHDLVNPLTALNLQIEQLYAQSKEGTSAELANIAESAKSAVAATKRVERFVTAARKQIRHQDVNAEYSPSEELQQILLALAYRIRSQKVKVVQEIPENIVLHGSPVKFYRVLQNLISNAVDAYEDSTKIAREVHVRFHETKEEYVLEVEDFAGGIPQKERAHIFEPFYTTKSLDKGTGIGLTIVRDIVELELKGSIAVKTKVGEGTLFTVTIPRTTHMETDDQHSKVA